MTSPNPDKFSEESIKNRYTNIGKGAPAGTPAPDPDKFSEESIKNRYSDPDKLPDPTQDAPESKDGYFNWIVRNLNYPSALGFAGKQALKRLDQAGLFFEPIAEVAGPHVMKSPFIGGGLPGMALRSQGYTKRDPESERLALDFLTGRGDLSGPELAGELRSMHRQRPFLDQLILGAVADPLVAVPGPGWVAKALKTGAARLPGRLGRAVPSTSLPSTALAVREPVEAAAAEGLGRIPTLEDIRMAGSRRDQAAKLAETRAIGPRAKIAGLEGRHRDAQEAIRNIEDRIPQARLRLGMPETGTPQDRFIRNEVEWFLETADDQLVAARATEKNALKTLMDARTKSRGRLAKEALAQRDAEIGRGMVSPITRAGDIPTTTAARTEAGISSALEKGKYSRWWTKESEEGRRKAESLMQSTDPADHAQGVEDYKKLVAAPIRFLTTMLEQRGYEDVLVQSNFGYFGGLEPSFRASVKSTDPERLMADIAEIADVDFKQTSVLLYEPTTETAHRYFRGAAGVPDYSIEPIFSFRTTGGQDISGKQWSEIQKLMGGRRNTAWDGELELPGLSSHADNQGFDIIHVSKYGYDVTAPKNVGYDSVRKWIARVDAFAEETKTSYELRGILDVSEEGFRKLRHVGNSENWGDFAPHVAKNTADSKHSYPWYANYYSAKSPPSGTGTGSGRALEELPSAGLPAGTTRAQAAQAASEAPDTAATIGRGGGEIPPGTPVVADAGSLPPSASNVMDRISFEEPRQRLLDRFRSGLAGLKRAIADDLHPIDRFVTVSKELGSEVSLEENPYIWARLLRGISGKSNTFLEKGTFGKRYWKTEGGRAVPDFKGPGLYQILESVRDAGNHQAFSTYLTSRRAVELADKGIVTGIAKQDALKSIAELDRVNPGFRGTAQQVYKYQDDLIEYARESGLLSNDMVARLRTYKDYVPFHRVMDSMETQGFTGNKMANIVSPIKRMVGSERRIINPLESIIKNTHALIEAADRNQVGVMMARLASESPELQSLFKAKKTPVSKVAKVNAKELGIDISGLSEADANMLVDIFRPATYAKGANEVTVMINGQKRFFDVDPDLYKSLTNIDQIDLGLFGKFFGAPARWLRAGAVLSPDFMVKNPIRDQLTAFVYSKFGFLPGIDWMKGMGQMLNKSDDYHLYRMSGAEHSNLVSVDRAMTGRTVKEIAEEKGFTDYIKNPVDLLRTLSEVGEKGTRLGEFSRGLAAGETPAAAAFSAREVSQDFAKMGVVTRAVNQIIPFFGANVGGWTRAKTAFTERPIQSSAKAFLGITLPSVLLYSINRNDPRYKEIPQWQKDTFWIIPTPNAMLRFPKPFLVGQVFGSVPERFLEFLDERDPEMLTETLKSVVGEGVPGWAPQAVLPFVENATNHNFFLDRPIVPRDREDAPKEMQYSGRTTEAAKALGKWVNLSPAQIDNVFSAYTGGLGRYATDIFDPALRAIGIADRISDPDPTLADIPILRSFVVRDPYGSSGVSVDKFYDALKEFEGQEKMYKELITLGRQDAVVKYKDSHPSAGLGFDYKYGGVHYSATARALRRVAGAMSDVRKYQRGVYNSRTMSGGEKRSNIDASNKHLTLLAQKTLADLEKILP